MPSVFRKLDKARPLFDTVDKCILFLCKLLLVTDVLVTIYAVLGRYVSGYIPFIKDPAWSEEIVLTCMAYLAVLSAALAIRSGAHIRVTAMDRYLPKALIKSLDLLADLAMLFFAAVMLCEGWKYAYGLGAKGFYTSMPNLSLFWKYFPIPLAGVSMMVFLLESAYKHIKAFFIDEKAAGAKGGTAA